MQRDGQTIAPARIDRLGVFTLLWACQALIHQEYYQQWIREGMWPGWLLTGAALVVLARPGRIGPFAALLAISVVHNVERWPFVVNHILMESLLNFTMLLAIGWTAIGVWRRDGRSPASIDLGIERADDREVLFQRFAPVLMTMMVVMYYFAVLAKLNQGFLDPDHSCTTAMYGDLLRRFPFLPTSEWVKPAAIWGTIVVELAIPILFTFRRTRPLGMLVGLPFHLMLGLIGHRTFSGIVYVLYFLFISDEFTLVVNRVRDEIGRRLGAPVLPRLGIGFALAAAVYFLATAAGYAKAGIGPLELLHFGWLVWIGWSLCMFAAYLAAIAQRWLGLLEAATPARPRLATPGALWALVALVVLNGSAQYLGLKSETSFTMYSNLRTEIGQWNHLIVPASMRVFSRQDDLVEIVESSEPLLQRHADEGEYINAFELRRVVSQAQGDLTVTYRRGGETHHFELRDGVPSDPELRRRAPILLEKLLLFRPVPIGGRNVCQH
jgi:hypothetical protein